MLMRVGYGYNRTAHDFAHANVEQRWFDKNNSREDRKFMLLHGLRRGDILVLLDKSDLGRGGEIPMIMQDLENREIEMEICPPPKTVNPKGVPGPAPAFIPDADQDIYLKRVWTTPGYPAREIQEKVCAWAGWDGADAKHRSRARNYLNNRYGPRVKKRELK